MNNKHFIKNNIININQFIKLFLLIAFIVTNNTTKALDLLECWQIAMTRDPEYLVSTFELDLGSNRSSQSKSLWLPNIYLEAQYGLANFNSSINGAEFNAPGMPGPYSNAEFNNIIKHGRFNSNSIVLIQPLYDNLRLTQSRKLNLSATINRLVSLSGQQKIILKTSEYYCNVLLATEMLRLSYKQEQAINKMYMEINKRFKLGDASATDVQEALERLEEMKVKLISEENHLAIQKLALIDLCGNFSTLKSLNHNINFDLLHIHENIENLTKKMLLQNFNLRILKIMTEISEQEIEKYSLASSIKLEAIGKIHKEKLSSSKYNYAKNKINHKMLGIQFSMPLFTGSYRTFKEVEQINLAAQSRATLAKISLETEQLLRMLFLNLSTFKNRLESLENNFNISTSRLLSTIKKHAVGARSTLEVLGAHNDAINIEKKLYAEKIEFLLNILRLKFMLAELNEDVLKLINNSFS